MNPNEQYAFHPESSRPAEVKNTQVTIERALLLVGLTLLAIFVFARIQGTVLSRLAVQNFESSGKTAQMSSQLNENPAASHVNFSLWSESRIQAYKRSLIRRFRPALAVLRIAGIGLEVPVLDGTDILSLNRGVGWIRGTAQPGHLGNIGIAGHRDGFFRGLKDLRMGDRVELVTHDRTDTFVVDNIQVVSPQDVSVLRAGASSLTLVTCYPFYFLGTAPQRYVVHASMVRSESENSSRPSVAQVHALSQQ